MYFIPCSQMVMIYSGGNTRILYEQNAIDIFVWTSFNIIK